MQQLVSLSVHLRCADIGVPLDTLQALPTSELASKIVDVLQEHGILRPYEADTARHLAQKQDPAVLSAMEAFRKNGKRQYSEPGS